MRNNYIYIAVMAGVSFLIRVIPMTVIRKQIKSRFLRSFLFYVPYVTLAVMTFPAIITAAAHPLAGAVALAAGVLLAWMGGGLFPVAVLCSVTVFVMDALL
ncbi:MAG: AzlD domain-containing protein [Oscillospiraceae bacterium]|nr:AzlD domain-containing protein [Oscillospiraceae bacterium]MBQ5413018.1 AzlD domain-containing protein [Oscillospiraceae bacterium]